VKTDLSNGVHAEPPSRDFIGLAVPQFVGSPWHNRTVPTPFTVAWVFAGIGGIERGMHVVGGTTILLSESWGPGAMGKCETSPSGQEFLHTTTLSGYEMGSRSAEWATYTSGGCDLPGCHTPWR